MTYPSRDSPSGSSGEPSLPTGIALGSDEERFGPPPLTERIGAWPGAMVVAAVVGFAALFACMWLGFVVDDTYDLPGSETTWMTISFFVGCAVLIVIVATVSRWRTRARERMRRHIDAWAARRGFWPLAATSLLAEVDIAPLAYGGTVKASGWTGTADGRAAEILFATVEQRRDDRRYTEEYTVVAARIDRELPARVELVASLGAARALAAYGAESLDTTGTAAADGWIATTSDAAAGREMLERGIAEAASTHRGVDARFTWVGDVVVVASPGLMTDAGDLEARLALVESLARDARSLADAPEEPSTDLIPTYATSPRPGLPKAPIPAPPRRPNRGRRARASGSRARATKPVPAVVMALVPAWIISRIATAFWGTAGGWIIGAVSLVAIYALTTISRLRARRRRESRPEAPAEAESPPAEPLQ